jgi:NAD(P)-dependent dehydrogenase (short-subunit alcohol dehydrogenase family)
VQQDKGDTMRFAGNSVLITGAGSGFGRLAAERFAGEGARLTLQDISDAGLAETAERVRAKGGEVAALAGDVSVEAHAKTLVELALASYGRLDIALNNAGTGNGIAAIPQISVEDFDRVMAVNARGVFLGMKYQIPAIAKGGGGSILNTASAAGVIGAGYLGAYAASKHAVVGLTRAAADESARQNIRINAICPSFAATPMFNAMADQMSAERGMTREEAYARIASRVPLRRVAAPEEIVQAMLWIVSPENSFMTGQAISIDGGLTAV